MSQKSAIISCPLNSIASAFARVADAAQHLKVASVVRSTARHCQDVVDFKLDLLPTEGTAVFLKASDFVDVLAGECAAIFQFLDAPCVRSDRHSREPVLTVGHLPRFERGF